MLDIRTLIAVLAAMMIVAACILFGNWRRRPEARYLLLWGVAAVFGGVGITLSGLRGVVPMPIAILVGNALSLQALGFVWLGLRAFDYRSLPGFWTLVLPAVWLAFCSYPEIYQSLAARIAVYSVLAVIASIACAATLWRGRGDGLSSRKPFAVVLVVHAVFSALRIVHVLLTDIPSDLFANDFVVALSVLEPVVALFAAILLGFGLVRERTETELRQAAALDGLTNVLNRRGFMERAERLAAQAGREGQAVALLAFDLDRFKQINDQFGHAAGDAALKTFADVLSGSVRQADIVGRTGGEEFMAMLVGADETLGWSIAERVRREFARAGVVHAGGRLWATVSAGVALADGAAVDLPTLMDKADRALYRAKRDGRDVVRGDKRLAG